MSTPNLNVRTDVSVTINVPAYRDQFVTEIAGHIADLNHAINDLEAGTFVNRAKERTNSQGSRLSTVARMLPLVV